MTRTIFKQPKRDPVVEVAAADSMRGLPLEEIDRRIDRCNSVDDLKELLRRLTVRVAALELQLAPRAGGVTRSRTISPQD